MNEENIETLKWLIYTLKGVDKFHPTAMLKKRIAELNKELKELKKQVYNANNG